MDYLLHDLLIGNVVFAQMLNDVDILQDITDAWQNFVATGQVWALLIGVFFGYVFASFTRF